MENKKENITVTNNGIRIKGNVSAFSQYNHDRQSSSEKAKKATHGCPPVTKCRWSKAVCSSISFAIIMVV